MTETSGQDAAPIASYPHFPISSPVEADGDWELAGAIAAAVAATPGVVAVRAVDPAAATYGPAVRVDGVRLSREAGGLVARLHLVLASFDLPPLLARVRASACRAAAQRRRPLERVDVHVEDVVTETRPT